MTEALKRVVVHPRLYLGVGKGGRLQHIKPGTVVTLTATQCKSLGARVAELGTQGAVDIKAHADAEVAAKAHADAVAKVSKAKK